MVKVFWCVLFAHVATTTSFSQNIVDGTINNLPEKPKVNSLGYLASENFLQLDSSSYSRPSRLKSWIQIAPEKTVLTARSIVIPSAMIAYGAFTLTNKDLKRVNLAVKNKLWEDRNDGNGKRLHIDNFTLVAPALAVYGLSIAGVKGKNNLVDASIIYGMSHLIGQVLIVSNVKKLTSTMRPDSSNRLSFPSGHTAQAFISAEFLRREYKDVSPWIGVAGYAVAVGTGFLRMYNNKHWLNDVIAGAGVGILSTHISYWLYPKIKNTFLGKWKGNTIVAPTYQNRAIGVGMIHKF
jgi:hypothetical protein